MITVEIETNVGYVDVSDKLISLTLHQSLCNASTNASIVLEDNGLPQLLTYKKVRIFKDAVLKRTLYIGSITHQAQPKVVVLDCENASKRLADYWIGVSLQPDSPVTTTRYWLEQILNLVGSPYSFLTDSQGEYIEQESQLGYTDAKSVVMNLLAQSGWYITYDANDTILIGKIETSTVPTQVYTETDILDLSVNHDDRMYRNRAVVWGKGYASGWVFADLYRPTAIDYDSRDIRTVVVANHLINSKNTAKAVANRLLNEFAKETVVTTFSVPGFADVSLADTVDVDTQYEQRRGIVTTLEYRIDSSGEITTIILNERCPRIIGAFDIDGYVYIGTAGDGVWRKPLKYIHTWSDYSTGLSDLNVTDLSIAQGMLATVAGDSLYYRYEGDSSWTQVTSITTTTSGGVFPMSSLEARACSVDKDTGTVYGLYTLKNSYYYNYGFLTPSGTIRSWMYKRSNGGSVSTHPVRVGTKYDYLGVDIEATGPDTAILTAITSGVAFYGLDICQQGDLAVSSELSFKLPGTMPTPPRGITNHVDPFVQTGYVLYLDNAIIYNNIAFTSINQAGVYGIQRKDISTNEILGTIFLPGAPVFSNPFVTITAVSDSIAMMCIADNVQGVTAKRLIIASFDFLAGFATIHYQSTQTVAAIYFFADQLIYKNNAFFMMWSERPTTTGNFSYYYTHGALTQTNLQKKFLGVDDQLSILYTDYKSDFIAGVYFDYADDTGYMFKINIKSGAVTKNEIPYMQAGSLYVSYATIRTDYTKVYYSYTDNTSNDTYILEFDENLNLSSPIILSTSIGIYYAYLVVTKRGAFAVIFPTTDYYYPFVINLNEEDPSTHLRGKTIYTFPTTEINTNIAVAPYGDDVTNSIYFMDNKETIYRLSETGVRSLVCEIPAAASPATAQLYLSGNAFFIGDETLLYDPTKMTTVSRSEVLQYSNGHFSKVTGGLNDNKIEISKDTPAILYGGSSYTAPSGTYNFAFGFLSLAYYPTSGYRDVPLIGRNPNFNYPITDARAFTLTTASGVSNCVSFCQNNTISGISALGLIDTSYILNGIVRADEDGLLTYSGISVTEYYPYQYIDISRWHSFSGIINHLETTNTQDSPYMFVSLEGPVFYQKDAYSLGEPDTAFIPRNTNLPSSEITIIRVDDII